MIESEHFSFGHEIGKSIINALVEKAVDLVCEKNSNKKIAKSTNKIEFENKILNHFTQAYKWSSIIEFIGMNKPIKVDEKSVDLDLTFNVRKFTNKDPEEATFDSSVLVTDENNFLILGDPGSGKSTMLKRLLKKYFFSENNETCFYNFPLLVKFRDIKEYQTLYTYICEMLGIQYENKEISYIVKVEKSIPVLDNEGKHLFEMDEKIYYNTRIKEKRYLYTTILIDEERKRYEYFIQGERIEIVLSKMLDDNRVLVIMDGLDEANYLISREVEEQVSYLGSKLINSKVLVTCRPDYIEKNFSDFNTCQICDLTERQTERIAKLWLANTSDFIDSLEGKSYIELTKRPLFLGFLLFLYQEYNSLPSTSREVYLRIVNLLVEKWDKDRGIRRHAVFPGFDSLKMVDFLSHLSFNLLYVLKVTSFTDEDLQKAYLRIKDRFNLSAENAKRVCNEIENHTGLIHRVFYDKYEFSHLYLQEYLCAAYIVSSGRNHKIISYLKDSPASVAMAVSLSTESSIWFSNIIFDFFAPENASTFIDQETYTTKIAKIILRKLIIETPYFEKEEYLGIAIMALCKISNCKDEEFVDLIERFVTMHANVKFSIESALEHYRYLSFDKRERKIYFAWQNQHLKIDSVSDSQFASTVCLPVTVGVQYLDPSIRKHFGML